MDQLWEYRYGLLSEAEAEALKVRIEQEPEVAAAYEQVRLSAERIAEAAKVVSGQPLSFSAPEPEEKTNISPPPEVPEEISGTFTVVLESLQNSSARLKPPILASKKTREESRADLNPFASRFSPQYARLNRILTVSAIFLLVLTLTGFGLVRQTRVLLTNSLLQIQVVAPNQLSRETQNTLSINVSDWRGLPKQVPIRVRLLSEFGEKIALYQEKTDSQGSLNLALEGFANLSENAFVEISAGEEKTARTVCRMIPVASQEVRNEEWEVESGEGIDFFELSNQSRVNMAPYSSNSQNALTFPSQTNRMGMGGGMGGMSGGTDGMGQAGDVPASKPSNPVPFREPRQPLPASAVPARIPSMKAAEMQDDSASSAEVPESVALHGDRFLQIEKWDDRQAFPGVLRITDERGEPVAATVRFSWSKNAGPQAKTAATQISFDNQKQFHAELKSLLAHRKPVFSEMLGFFTTAAICGGVIVSGVIIVLFFLRRLSGSRRAATNLSPTTRQSSIWARVIMLPSRMTRYMCSKKQSKLPVRQIPPRFAARFRILRIKGCPV